MEELRPLRDSEVNSLRTERLGIFCVTLAAGEFYFRTSSKPLGRQLMALLLSESDVQNLLTMPKAIERVEASFVAQHGGEGVNRSRERIFLPHASLHYMAAALPEQQLLGMKIYTISRSAWRFLVLLYDSESGQLLAVIEADHLGRIRTGAASGVATKYLARSDASRVGLIGTGRQARTQLEAMAQVRSLKGVRVYGRDESRLRAFCKEMSAALGLDVAPASSAEAAARFGDIVVTATTAKEPVLRGVWLGPGVHVNAIGANMAERRELDDECLSRAALITVDSLAQAREEAGDLILGLSALPHGWQEVVELHDVVGGRRPGRNTKEEITLFKSTGIAFWDVAAAGYVYAEALRSGKGREFEIGGHPEP